MPDEPQSVPQPLQWVCPHARPGQQVTQLQAPGVQLALCGLCCAEWAVLLAQATHQRVAQDAAKNAPQLVIPAPGALGGLAQFPRQN